MVAPDNDPTNLNQYSGYDDPTGTPTPLETEGQEYDDALHDLMVADRTGAASDGGGGGGGGAATLESFEITGLTPAISSVSWGEPSNSSGHWYNMQRTGQNQNAEIVLPIPGVLKEGTWDFHLYHSENSSHGIFTISISDDGEAWTDIATVDAYNGASSTPDQQTKNEDLVIPAGIKYVRFKMATKNASSSNYFGAWQSLVGIRTGD